MRVALLGSPGVALPYRTGLLLTGSGSTVTGAAATYAAVVAGHHLDLSLSGYPNVIIVFTGLEAAQADFLLALNAQSQGLFKFTNAAGQIKVETTVKGSMAVAAILGSSSADVLASLGLAAGALAAGTGVTVAGYGPGARMYCGGVDFQKFLPIATGKGPMLLMLDRGDAPTVFSDNTRFFPTAV